MTFRRLTRSIIGAVLATAALTAVAAPVGAAPGDLDTGFSDDGSLVIERGARPTEPVPIDTVVLPSGKILVLSVADSSAVAVTRLLADGRVDPTFGSGGSVFTIPGVPAQPTAFAVRDDGSIVVVGGAAQIGTFAAAAFAVRFTPDGEIDRSFGVRGTVLLSIGTQTTASDVVPGPGGSFYLSGGVDGDAYVARLSATGGLVSSYGAGGVRRIDVLGGTARTIISRHGTGVLVGFNDTGIEATAVTRVVRVTAGGSIDATFGGATGVIRDVTLATEAVRAIVLSGERILVVVGLSGDAQVVALTSTGLDDATWGVAGQLAVPLPGDISAVGGAVTDSAGRLVISGVGATGESRSWVGARVTASGAMDATFGVSGLVDFPALPIPNLTVSVAVAGSGYVLVGGGADEAIVQRLRASGSLLDTFGTAGVARFRPITSSAIQVDDVSILPDGGSVALSTSYRNGFEVNVWRHDAQGRPVRSFGNDGVASWRAGSNDIQGAAIRRLADGRFVIASSVDDGGANRRVQLMRLTAAGRPDTTFGPNGRRLLAPGRLTDVSGIQLMIDDDGRYMVGVAQSSSIDLVRVKPNGQLDGSFGTDGVATIPAIGYGALAAMGELGNGRWSVVDTAELRVIRLLEDGSLDASFGVSGVRPLVADPVFQYADVDLTPQGDMVLLSDASSSVTKVTRLSPGGQPVASFGTAGVVTLTSPPGVLRSLSDVTLRNDGSVVLLGIGTRTPRSFISLRAVVMRLRPNGTRDASFSDDGVAEFNVVPDTAEFALTASVRQTRILIGGFTYEASSRMILTRIRA